AIRLGFVVTPPWARRALVAVKQSADWQCSALEQATLAAFIDEGHLARHVRKMRRIYRARHDVLLEGLQSEFGRWLEPLPSVVGMHMAAFARSPLDTQAIAKRAQAAEVGVYTLREYQFIKPARPGFVFGYGAIAESEIGEALARLRSVWLG